MPTPTPQTMKRVLYSAADLMGLLNISTSTMEDWLRRGRLPPPVRPGGPRGKRYWQAEEIEKLIATLNSGTTASAV